MLNHQWVLGFLRVFCLFRLAIELRSRKCGNCRANWACHFSPSKTQRNLWRGLADKSPGINCVVNAVKNLQWLARYMVVRSIPRIGGSSWRLLHTLRLIHPKSWNISRLAHRLDHTKRSKSVPEILMLTQLVSSCFDEKFWHFLVLEAWPKD